MGARVESEGHRGVCLVVRVERSVVNVDAGNFKNYPYLRTFNPHLLVAGRIIDHMQEFGKVVLTAHKNGGPIAVYTNGILVDTSIAVSERNLGLTIKSFDPQEIKDLEQADVIARKVVRDGKAVVFEMVS